ncbi:MAG: putative dsRNA-binding protein [Solirubrobacterales bacterium]
MSVADRKGSEPISASDDTGNARPAALTELLEGLAPQFYREVFTHSSWTEVRTDSYERLAFLGDSVLGLAISTELYPRFADATAGDLTKIRAQAVSGAACARVALELDVPRRLTELAPAEPEIRIEELLAAQRVLASICESVIGACYLQYGYEVTAEAVVATFAHEIDLAFEHPGDFKSRLQERLARRGDKPHYALVSSEGPPHDVRFVCAVEIRGDRYGTGNGRSKKEAEQAAAGAALARLDEEHLGG